MPLEVPRTIEAEIAIHVGEPKLRFPASENACPFNFWSLVHRTTSHGGEVVSVSLESRKNWLLIDACLLCPVRKAGEEGRGDSIEGVEIRDWNRRSNGRNEGVGLPSPGREARDGTLLLPGEDIIELLRTC